MTSEGTGKRRWLPSRHAMVPLAALGLILCIPLYRLFSNMRASTVLERELERIRAKGEPASLGELGVGDVPDDENGAPLYARAFALITKNEAAEPQDWQDWTDVFYERDKPFDECRADLEAVLRLHAKAMDLAREAAAKPRCVFDLDYRKGYELEGPHLFQLRHLGRLFAAEALLRAHSGRPDGAAASLTSLFRLAHALDDEPLLISKLVQRGMTRQATSVLRRIERASPMPDVSRRKTIQALLSFDHAGSATQAMMGERLFYLQDYDFGHGRRPPLGRVPGLKGGATKRLSATERLQLIRLMTQIVEASRRPPWEARPVIEARYKEVWELLPWTADLCSFDDEPWKRYYTAFMGAMTHSDAAVIGLSCELYGSEYGRYPDKLDALVPEFLDKLPPDPFTGKPFVYKIKDNGKGFVVYSVGENLTDDGGVEDRYSSKGGTRDDIAWEGRPGANKN